MASPISIIISFSNSVIFPFLFSGHWFRTNLAARGKCCGSGSPDPWQLLFGPRALLYRLYGVMSSPVGMANLVPLGITSMPFAMASAKVAKSFRFPAGSISRSSTVASTTEHYELSECVITSTDFLPASVKMPVTVTPSWIPALRNFPNS